MSVMERATVVYVACVLAEDVAHRLQHEQPARVGVELLGPLAARECDLRPADRGQEPVVSGSDVAEHLVREGHDIVIQGLALIPVADDDSEMVGVVEEQHDVETTLSPIKVFYPVKGTVLILAVPEFERGEEHVIATGEDQPQAGGGPSLCSHS
jgi:hypothetical protein